MPLLTGEHRRAKGQRQSIVRLVLALVLALALCYGIAERRVSLGRPAAACTPPCGHLVLARSLRAIQPTTEPPPSHHLRP